jgi:hypothetical protein
MSVVQNMDKMASERFNIADFYYSLAFIIIWLLFAFWSGYKHSKEILISAVLYASLPIVNTLYYSLKPHVESAIFNPSILDKSSFLWLSISSGIDLIFINILGRPDGIAFSQYITYFPLIMLILFVITYVLASKISLSKKSKEKPALNLQ